MIPIIDDRTQTNTIGFNVSKRVEKLIHVVPREHLVGLEKIVVVDQIKDRKKEEAGGIYRQKSKDHPCSIELAFGTIYKGMPKILFLLPFVSDFILANVLYHEIGHHLHKTLTHGVSNQMQEGFAENYRKELVKKRFRWWLYFLLPLSPVISYVRRTRASEEK